MELLFFSCLGIINRGDSFRRKRSRSNSLATSPMSPNHSPSTPVPSRSSTGPVESYRVSMLGGPGVGKTALISQFCTSECINAYEDTGKNIRIYVCIQYISMFPICKWFHSLVYWSNLQHVEWLPFRYHPIAYFSPCLFLVIFIEICMSVFATSFAFERFLEC